ncbi:YbaN family protein [Desulfofalx alkaliphila]|uniref:YbaN family protein n=1 Tax=Desulfofalx alkaliphila TaxID=105483 RepID=UPI000690AAE3|nr:YbaN family protein [Desulfofalx alkaliphila]
MKKILLTLIGTLSLILGIIGIILPILPTTPFLLLSLYCYVRSSEKIYYFILNNKYLAPYVKDYISGKGIPLKAKKKAIFLIWLTIGFSIVFVVSNLFARIILLIIAVLVSIYIWTRSTREN